MRETKNNNKPMCLLMRKTPAHPVTSQVLMSETFTFTTVRVEGLVNIFGKTFGKKTILSCNHRTGKEQKQKVLIIE